MIIVARKHVSFGYNGLGLVAETLKFFCTPNLNRKDALQQRRSLSYFKLSIFNYFPIGSTIFMIIPEQAKPLP